MAVRIIWSRLARKDLREIFYYIHRVNQAAAIAVVCALEEKVETLADFPELGAPIPGKKSSPLRELIHRPYRIPYSYSVEQNEIHIVRVWHAARGDSDLGPDS